MPCCLSLVLSLLPPFFCFLLAERVISRMPASSPGRTLTLTQLGLPPVAPGWLSKSSHHTLSALVGFIPVALGN